MPTDQTLSIIVKLQDEASAGLAALSNKMNAVGTSVGTAVAGLGTKLGVIGDSMVASGQKMTSIGRSMSVGLTLPIVAVGTAASKMAMDYQASTEMLTTNAGYAQEATDKLSKSVLDFAASGQSQFTAQDMMANGLYHIASLGVPAANAMDVLKAATTGAAVGQASLESVSNALGAAVASNIKGSTDYTDAMATLVGITGAGNMHMEELATSIGKVLPAATTAGLSLQDVGAGMATMTDNGLTAAISATNLSHTIMMMAAPTKNAQAAFDKIGLTQFQLADDMRNKGLLPALQDLKKHMEDAGQSADQQMATISQAFGGARTGSAIMLLLNNLDRVGQKYTLINQGIDDYQQKVIAQGKTAGASFAEMQASISASTTEVGNALLPLEANFLPALANAIKDVATWFTNLSPSTQEWIVKGLALIVVIGPILAILGPIVTSLGFMAKGIAFLLPQLGELMAGMAGDATTMSAFSVAAAPFLITLAAIATAVVLITTAFNNMQDAMTTAGKAADTSQAVLNSQAWKDAYAKASPDEKAKMDSIAGSNNSTTAATRATVAKYSGVQGGFNALGDTLSGKNATWNNGGATAPAVSRQPAPVLNFNFNGATAGDDGIKSIITQTVDSMNRSSQLRTFTGTR